MNSPQPRIRDHQGTLGYHDRSGPNTERYSSNRTTADDRELRRPPPLNIRQKENDAILDLYARDFRSSLGQQDTPTRRSREIPPLPAYEVPPPVPPKPHQLNRHSAVPARGKLDYDFNRQSIRSEGATLPRSKDLQIRENNQEPQAPEDFYRDFQVDWTYGTWF